MSSKLSDTVRLACITGLGSGYTPFASGSWGSLVAGLLFAAALLVMRSFGCPVFFPDLFLVIAILAACVLAVRWGGWAIARFGRKDPKQFTLDEFAGQWVALLFMPFPIGIALLSALIIGGGQFVLFRVFDVWKPWPARQLERLPAGWGILLDDIFAGIYANLIGQALWRVTPLAAWAQSLAQDGR